LEVIVSNSEAVIPAKAGIQGIKLDCFEILWIPAFAGMTAIHVSCVNQATS
jgi:hypothetical protein